MSPGSRRPGRPLDSGALYRRGSDDLRRRLLSGEWKAGMKLPSLSRLSNHYQVSKRTAALAVEQLKDEGWIYARERRQLIARQAQSGLVLEGNFVLEVITRPLAGS